MKRLVTIITCFVAMALVHCSAGLSPEIRDGAEFTERPDDVSTEGEFEVLIEYSFPLNDVTDENVEAFIPQDDDIPDDVIYGDEYPIGEACDEEKAEVRVDGTPILSEDELSIVYTSTDINFYNTKYVICTGDITFKKRGINPPDDKMIFIKTESPSDACTVPTQTTVNEAIVALNLSGLLFSGITSFPMPELECVKTRNPVVYSMTGLPDSLTFDPDDRTVSLAEGTDQLGPDSTSAIDVVYAGTVDGTTYTTEDTYNLTLTDNDEDGMEDNYEFMRATRPQVSSNNGSLLLDSDLENLIAPLLSGANTIDSGILITGSLSPTDASDALDNYDGDSFINSADDNVFVWTPETAASPSFALAENNGLAVAYSVTMGNWDNDGALDVVAVQEGPVGQIVTMRGNGDGTFLIPISYTIAVWAEMRGVTMGDFDRDGDQDMATAYTDTDQVAIISGDGTGGFVGNVTYAVSNEPYNIATADFNADGWLDLVVTHLDVGPSDVIILLNDGDGTFTVNQTISIASRLFPVCIADLNNDGVLDFVVGGWSTDNVFVFFGVGDGTFGTTPTEYNVGDAPRGIQAADFNNDGWVDLAVANNGDSNVSILLNSGEGVFAAAVNYSVGTNSAPGNFGVADLNGDGNIDIATTSFANDAISILENTGDSGTFEAAVEFSVTGDEPQILTLGDLDADGDIDIITVNLSGGTYSSMLNQTNP